MSMQVIGLLYLQAGYGAAALAADGPIYKWLDEEGRTHYARTLPPEAAGRPYQQLNGQAVVIEQMDPAEAAEQNENADRVAEQQREKPAGQEAELIRQRLLLVTYPSREDVFLARDRKLERLDREAALVRRNLEMLRQRLDQLHSRRRLEQDKAGSAALLQARIDSLEDAIGNEQQRIARIDRRRRRVQHWFDVELASYDEAIKQRQNKAFEIID